MNDQQPTQAPDIDRKYLRDAINVNSGKSRNVRPTRAPTPPPPPPKYD